MKKLFCFLIALAPLSSPATSAATDWAEQDGARIRLVAAEPAPDATEIRAALVVELKPGWKTYWRDPGDAGVPPQFTLGDAENIASARLDYPAPERFAEGTSNSNGYEAPVAFPLTLTLKVPGAPNVVKASAFLGICEDICVPVQLDFALEVPAAAASTPDQALVQAAFDALPKPASAAFGLANLAYQPDALDVEIAAPLSDSPPELFVAADRFQFGAPKLVATANEKTRFSVPILFAPKDARIEDAELHYTLKSGGMAVSGSVPARAN